MILNKFLLAYFVSLSIVYGLTAFGFLVKLFNPVQRALSKIFRQEPFYTYLQMTQGVFCIVICVLWVNTQDLVKVGKEHLEVHQDKTSFDYIEDKEDLFRNERNLYLYAGAFFVTLANARLLSLIHDYYQSVERTEIVEKKLKQA